MAKPSFSGMVCHPSAPDCFTRKMVPTRASKFAIFGCSVYNIDMKKIIFYPLIASLFVCCSSAFSEITPLQTLTYDDPFYTA